MSAVRFKPLEWRKPTDHPCDHEDALFVADGLGGRYAIEDHGAYGFILWWAHDEFTFVEGLANVEVAKQEAERDWQKRLAEQVQA